MKEFYDAKPSDELGDPAADPPLTMRIHPDDNPRSKSARRAVKNDAGLWGWITGRPAHELTDDVMAAWPYTHWLVAATAFRHAEYAKTTAQKLLELDGSDAEGSMPFKDKVGTAMHSASGGEEVGIMIDYPRSEIRQSKDDKL